MELINFYTSWNYQKPMVFWWFQEVQKLIHLNPLSFNVVATILADIMYIWNSKTEENVTESWPNSPWIFKNDHENSSRLVSLLWNHVQVNQNSSSFSNLFICFFLIWIYLVQWTDHLIPPVREDFEQNYDLNFFFVLSN